MFLGRTFQKRAMTIDVYVWLRYYTTGIIQLYYTTLFSDCILNCIIVSVHHPPTLYRLCRMVPGTVDYPTVSHVGPTTLFPMYCLRLLLYTDGTVRTTLRSLKLSKAECNHTPLTTSTLILLLLHLHSCRSSIVGVTKHQGLSYTTHLLHVPHRPTAYAPVK